MLFGLNGRVAMVTGAGTGLGRAIALGLSRSGAMIAAADIDDALLEETIDHIQTAGGKAIAVHCNVGSRQDVDEAFGAVDDAFGRIDILVNNAAINEVRCQSEDYPLDAWERTLNINLTGAFLCSRAAGKRMISQGEGGSIINVSSINGSSAPRRGVLAYDVSKSGVNQLTRDLAIDWAPHRIRVNAIQPCQFRTRGWRDVANDPAHEPLMKAVLHGIPLGRLGEPGEVVGPVVFLASQAASMITGALLPVDGGNLAMNAGAGGTVVSGDAVR